MKKEYMKRFAYLTIALLGLKNIAQAHQNSLSDCFLNPSAENRPVIIWQWMDGLVSKEAITNDLESFKAAGLSGVQNFQIGGDNQIRVGDPSCSIGSEKWKQLMRWAMEECDRLGLVFGTHNCPGWSSSAYCSVRPEYSMQKLVFSEANAGEELKILDVDPAYNYYEDIAILAMPADSIIDKNSIIDISPYLSPMKDGKWEDKLVITDEIVKKLPSPINNMKFYRFGHTTNGKTNSAQSPLSGQGLECDKLRREAVKHFWDGYPQMLIDLAGPYAGKSFRYIEIDSYEAGGQDWSVVLPEEFKKLKGYDIIPFLPYIADIKTIDSKNDCDKFKKDLVDVITSLVAENYYGYMAELIESTPGMQLLVEPYGTGRQKPFQMLDIHKILNCTPKAVMMTEFWVKPNWGWKDMGRHEKVIRNLQRPMMWAEAFTCWPLHAWKDSPETLKPICDRAFCTGVNRMILHAGACNPWNNVEPGMSFGVWGTQFTPGQTWWKAGGARALFDYMTRCQSLLQRGFPAKQQWNGSSKFKTYQRSDGDSDIVFLCNPTDKFVCDTLQLESISRGRTIELWNPYNMHTTLVYDNAIPLSIEPNGSRFLIFHKGSPITDSHNSLVSLQTDEFIASDSIVINKGWTIAFPEIETLHDQSLFDWSTHEDDDIKYFSGTATYNNIVKLTKKHLKASRLILDLGSLKDMAKVKVNGKEFPVMWKAPFTLDVTSALKPGNNSIEIEVTNLWPNRMIGDEQYPDDIQWSEPLIYEYAPGSPVVGRYMEAIPDWLKNGTPRVSKERKTVGCFKFFEKDSHLLPSGLFGNVCLKLLNH